MAYIVKSLLIFAVCLTDNKLLRHGVDSERDPYV